MSCACMLGALDDHDRHSRRSPSLLRPVRPRNAQYYLAPLPLVADVDADALWVPEGEDYGGLCDRLMVSAESP